MWPLPGRDGDSFKVMWWPAVAMGTKWVSYPRNNALTTIVWRKVFCFLPFVLQFLLYIIKRILKCPNARLTCHLFWKQLLTFRFCIMLNVSIWSHLFNKKIQISLSILGDCLYIMLYLQVIIVKIWYLTIWQFVLLSFMLRVECIMNTGQNHPLGNKVNNSYITQ